MGKRRGRCGKLSSMLTQILRWEGRSRRGSWGTSGGNRWRGRWRWRGGCRGQSVTCRSQRAWRWRWGWVASAESAPPWPGGRSEKELEMVLKKRRVGVVGIEIGGWWCGFCRGHGGFGIVCRHLHRQFFESKGSNLIQMDGWMERRVWKGEFLTGFGKEDMLMLIRERERKRETEWALFYKFFKPKTRWQNQKLVYTF